MPTAPDSARPAPNAASQPNAPTADASAPGMTSPGMTRRSALVATAAAAACMAFPLRALAALAPVPVAGRFVLTFAAHPVLANIGGSVVVRVPGGTGDAEQIVVTRTGAAAAAAASALCPHQGCSVNTYDVASARIVCPCHGSQFDVTGRLLQGPARQRLTPYTAAVESTGVAVEIPGLVDAARPDAPPLAQLSAPSPDPSRGPVRLAFTLATATHVRLVVTDALGRVLATLVDRPLAPGDHAEIWADSAAAPGLYVATLFADGAPVATRALTRVR